MPPTTLNSEEPQMSHAIPFLMFQVLKSNPWNLNVFWMFLEWCRGELHARLWGNYVACSRDVCLLGCLLCWPWWVQA